MSNESIFAGVQLFSPEKVLYSEQGITNQALAEYYEAVADWILPHVVRRPISLVRCPAGRARNASSSGMPVLVCCRR